TNNPFSLLSPEAVANMIQEERDVYVLDVRPDTSFRSATSMPILNSYGRCRKAHNLPFSALNNRFAEVTRDKKIIIVDNWGEDAHNAARQLAEQGYKDLFVLINGLDMWISEEKNDLENWKNLWVKTVGFDFMSSLDFHHKMQTHEKPIIL